jgi:cobalt-zinc-cadmium efflux system outer membrane protein
MARGVLRGGLVLGLSLLGGAGGADARQAPGSPGSSSLGAAPGDSGPVDEAPGGAGGYLPRRPGAGSPRVPSSATRPGGRPFGLPEPSPVSPVTEAPRAELPLYGRLTIPETAAEEGPPDGLTLDGALQRLVRANLELRSQFLEIPQAQADILTAGLRANPLLSADVQQVPYGQFSERRPGGPTQYDVNLTYPLDLNHKRRVRIEVACRARRVVEAQYQDAVRQQIAALYTAFVDVLAARATVRYARATIQGLDELEMVITTLRQEGEVTAADVGRAQMQRDAAAIGLTEAEEALHEAKRALVPVLNLSAAEAETLELRGTIRDLAPPPPPAEELVRLALAERPDLVAFRLGILRAEADVRLARATRFSDVFLLVQPYTFQDNSPFDKKSSHSWAFGVTVPLPIHDRNQGNIQRARINVAQTRLELATLEQRVATEVRQAERRYAVTLASVRRIERTLLPTSHRLGDEALRRYREGEADIVDYFNAQRENNELVRQYRDTAIRHRRSMLELNTAVGRRILP